MRKYDELLEMAKSNDLKTLARVYAELHIIGQLVEVMNKHMVSMAREVKLHSRVGV